jgi:hypothetical protein
MFDGTSSTVGAYFPPMSMTAGRLYHFGNTTSFAIMAK